MQNLRESKNSISLNNSISPRKDNKKKLITLFSALGII